MVQVTSGTNTLPSAGQWWHVPVINLLAGTLGGFAGIIIEHPFDTIKVRLQTSPNPVSLVKLTRTLIKAEGFKALYRGLTPPLVANVLETAGLFSVNGMIKDAISDSLNYERGRQLPMSAELCSGGITGFFVSFILTPAELIKCRLQIQNQVLGGGNPLYKGPIDCLIKSVERDGVSIIFRGHTATMLREIPGTAAWFGSYEACLRLLTGAEGDRSCVPAWKTIAAGAMGGVCYWGMLFPADTAKSMIQTQEERMSIAAAVKNLYNKGGIKYFYRGLTPTLLRAAPANAAVFGCYEITSTMLGTLIANRAALAS
eukprot:gb/GECG01006588.1/.p1 GENE.gb/GECG01006588.1/~~gb/GECG01006588.1/.p1  ORF type:complete len:314 (+),score=21.89 gb/GECG01006588.1/:1-942(+)